MKSASVLLLLGCGTVFALGLLHLVYTFVGPALRPRDPALVAQMRRSALHLTTRTDVWRAWLGFNASHSFGAMLFGAVFGWLAWAEPALLFHSTPLALCGFAWLAAMLAIGRRYWFRTPVAGLAFATACCVLAWALAGTA